MATIYLVLNYQIDVVFIINVHVFAILILASILVFKDLRGLLVSLDIPYFLFPLQDCCSQL
jgi:hypothetical protein